MKSLISKIDPRHFQIAFQLLFLSFGILQLGWDDYGIYFAYAGVALATQFIFQTIKKQPFDYRSPLISALGLCLLLHTSSLYTAATAAFIAIASKYLIQVKGRHIFNPSALGIVAVLAITNSAWISPGQWGTTVVGIFAVSVLGCIVVSRVQRLGTTLSFLGSYAGLMAIYQLVYLGWPVDYFIQTLSTGSLLIFSFFMITDPRTTPLKQGMAVAWGLMVGAVSFYLAAFHFMSTAPIWVLVFAQPLVPVLNAIPGFISRLMYKEPELFQQPIAQISLR